MCVVDVAPPMLSSTSLVIFTKAGSALVRVALVRVALVRAALVRAVLVRAVLVRAVLVRAALGMGWWPFLQTSKAGSGADQSEISSHSSERGREYCLEAADDVLQRQSNDQSSDFVFYGTKEDLFRIKHGEQMSSVFSQWCGVDVRV
jgi:hypothetical protein